MEIEIKMEAEVEVVLEKLMKAEGNAVQVDQWEKRGSGIRGPIKMWEETWKDEMRYKRENL